MDASSLTDALSDVLDKVEVRGIVTGGFAVQGPWVSARSSAGTSPRRLKLIALVAGSAWVSADGPGGPIGPLELSPGDVVLLNQRSHLEIRGGQTHGIPRVLLPEAGFDAMALSTADLAHDDVLVGGYIDVNPVGLELLGNALPGLVHVRAAAAGSARVAALVHRLFEEASSQRLGSTFAIRQNGQLLLLEVLRAHVEHGEQPAGWLRLLADESLAPAVRLIHGQPGNSWGLAELAAAAGMSRTSFAERFRAVAGAPPLTYLSNWRMLLAQRALRDPAARVGTIATELGYGSDSAFSNAFKREVGESPLQFRRRLQSAS